MPVFAGISLCRMNLRTGPFDGGRNRNRFARRQARDRSGDVELTFLGYPFESLGRALDPVLAIVAVSRQQPDHLIGAAGGRTGDIAGCEIDGLSNGKLVLQRPLHHARNVGQMLTVPLQMAD